MLIAHQPLLQKLRIVLGSQSKGRQELLKMLNLFDFRVQPSDFVENLDKSVGALEYTKNTSKGKVDDLLPKLTDWDICIFADTVCEINGEIIEKANTKEEASQFLQKFSGRSHLVHTSVNVVGKNHKNEIKVVNGVETTEVFFSEIPLEAINAYVEKENNWKGQAGGYAVQSMGNILISKINGDYSNVVGLPLNKLGILMCEIIDYIQCK